MKYSEYVENIVRYYLLRYGKICAKVGTDKGDDEERRR